MASPRTAKAVLAHDQILLRGVDQTLWPQICLPIYSFSLSNNSAHDVVDGILQALSLLRLGDLSAQWLSAVATSEGCRVSELFQQMQQKVGTIAFVQPLMSSPDNDHLEELHSLLQHSSSAAALRTHCWRLLAILMSSLQIQCTVGGVATRLLTAGWMCTELQTVVINVMLGATSLGISQSSSLLLASCIIAKRMGIMGCSSPATRPGLPQCTPAWSQWSGGSRP